MRKNHRPNSTKVNNIVGCLNNCPLYTGSRHISFKFLREALFPSVGTRKSVVRPSVRAPPFGKIIDFCEGDMEGASLVLSTDSLNF